MAVLLTAHDDGLRLLTLDSPERRNAIDPELRDELAAAVQQVADDPEARALVVAGSGPAFCGGGDLAALFGPPGRPVQELRTDLIRVYDAFLSIQRLPIPSIAVVHGAAVGAGFNLAMACDLRVMSPDGYLDLSFARLGIHPGGGATWFLTQALGVPATLELLLRGGRVDADQAVASGLASCVVADPMAWAMQLAADICRLDHGLVGDIRATVRSAATDGLTATVDVEATRQARSLARRPELLQPRKSRTAGAPAQTTDQTPERS
jgi:enoyl-CoA hydratase